VDAGSFSIAAFMQHLPTIAEYWWYWTQFVIVARVVYLVWKFSFRTSMIWYVKLVTDPLTDVIRISHADSVRNAHVLSRSSCTR